MRKFLTSILEKLIKKLKDAESEVVVFEKTIVEETPSEIKENNKKEKKKQKIKSIILYKKNPSRDLMEMMEVPFLALSKKRKNPIIYESRDGRVKVKVSRHTGHFLASIYDWDIILFVATKMQETLNIGKDIPPRTMIVPRHEILTAIHKHNVNTQQKELEKSLHRLKRTAIDTTIRNEDYRYKSDFGFLDSWEYTERKDIKEIKITLSQWLYDGICAQGALLKVDPTYFDITSAIKRFLYRTARKHVGNSDEYWEFSVTRLYEKSGSEREFKKFKSDLKTTVMANDTPGYTMQWIQKNKKAFVLFKRLSTTEKSEQISDEIGANNHKTKGNISRDFRPKGYGP
jgi:plasmid replication initiation protein